jgi:hypothetical protein
MTTTFQTEIYRIKEEAVAERDRRINQWTPVSKHLKKIFTETAQILADGWKPQERNGNVNLLQHGKDSLEFRFDRQRVKVIRTSTREEGEREYDLEAIDEDGVKAEVREFVRSVYS